MNTFLRQLSGDSESQPEYSHNQCNYFYQTGTFYLCINAQNDEKLQK